MWSGNKIPRVRRIILGCFIVAIHYKKDGSHLWPAAHSDLRVAMRAIRTLLDFSLIAQNRRHTIETIKYMFQY